MAKTTINNVFESMIFTPGKYGTTLNNSRDGRFALTVLAASMKG
jgi:hypothetical protein